jgi:hypothetical protein
MEVDSRLSDAYRAAERLYRANRRFEVFSIGDESVERSCFRQRREAQLTEPHRYASFATRRDCLIAHRVTGGSGSIRALRATKELPFKSYNVAIEV